MATTVDLITDNGEIAPFKASDAPALIRDRGFLPATPDNLKLAQVRKAADSLGGQALAGLEGTARGLSAGTSDAIEAMYLGADPHAIIARHQANPGTSLVGELLGGVGLGAAMLSGVGEATLATVVGVGATQGALNALGSATSDAVLNNKPFQAEAAAQQVAFQAMLGGASGALGYGASKGIGALSRKAATASVFAEEQALRDLGVSGRDMAKLARSGRVGEVGRTVLEEGVVPGGAQANASKIADKARVLGDELNQHLSTANPVAPAPLASDFNKLAQTPAFDKRPAAWRELLQSYSTDFSQASSLAPQELQSVKLTLDDAIVREGGREAPRELLKARKLVNDALEGAVQDPAAYAAAKDGYGIAAEAAKAAEKGIAKELGKGGPFAESVAAAQSGHVVNSFFRGVAGTVSSITGSLGQVADQVGSARWVQALAALGNKKITQNAIQLFGGAAGARALGPSVGDYDSVSQAVKDSVENPTISTGRAMDSFDPAVATHQGDVVNGAVLQAQQAMQYLYDQMPKSPLPQGVLDSDYRPPAYQKAQWLDMYRGIANPWSVAAHPTEDSLNALKAIYPATYQQIIAKLQENLGTNKALTYQQKLKLSRLGGGTTSTMTSPDFVATMQGIQSQPQQKPAGQEGSARTERAKQMNLKKASEDEATQFNRFQEN